jgi:hypothetical protein
MTAGTKSVLFGVHAFWLHPWFVAWAWWKLYGWPHDPRLWAAFFVHDLGYVGKPDMDGPAGKQHVNFGAAWMARFDYGRLARALNLVWGRLMLFRPEHDLVAQGAVIGPGWVVVTHSERRRLVLARDGIKVWRIEPYNWHDFTLYHSRFVARYDGVEVSPLCYADKLSLCLTPAWLWLIMARASGEIREYMAKSVEGEKYAGMASPAREGERAWLVALRGFLGRWVEENAHNGKVLCVPWN